MIDLSHDERRDLFALYGEDYERDMQTKQQQKTESQPTEQSAPLNRHQRRALLKRYRNELAKAKKVKKK